MSLACAALVLVLPALAVASHGPVDPYAQGRYGVGGVYQTDGFNQRDWNKVWHEPGYFWSVWYELSPGSGGYAGFAEGTSNPTQWPHAIGYGKSSCYNGNDDSGTLWTCQTHT